MVAAVRERGGDLPPDKEDPGGGEVSPHEGRAQHKASKVDHRLLHGVAVEGGHGTGGLPVVVHLVDVLEEEGRLVEGSGAEKRTS